MEGSGKDDRWKVGMNSKDPQKRTDGSGVLRQAHPWDRIGYDPYKMNMFVVDDDQDTLIIWYLYICSNKGILSFSEVPSQKFY